MSARLRSGRELAQRKSGRRNPESGYTLLIALLMVATILLLLAAASPNIFIEGRRDRDEEMIWRGQQYVRAIGLYYRKYGHYPHTVDDLTNSDNQIRFLRQAYKDPMNSEDGSWRLIYVGAAGQLINSVMYTNISQVPGPGQQGVAGASAAAGSAPPAAPTGGAPTVAPAGTGSATPDTGASGGGTSAAATDSDESQPQPLEGEVIGGNLVGVGSKVKKPSIKVYNGGTTYYQWEFIWKPLQGLPPGAGAAAPAPNPSGGTPAPTNSTMPGDAAPDQNQPPQTPGQ